MGINEKELSQVGEIICYCFDYTREDIVNDYLKNGESLIMARIAAEMKAGNCRCNEMHPQRR